MWRWNIMIHYFYGLNTKPTYEDTSSRFYAPYSIRL